MKPKSWKQGLSQTTENYASRTSIHGIGYIFDWDLSFADRLLWTIFTLSFLALAILLTWNNWTQWQENQVKTLSICPTAFCMSWEGKSVKGVVDFKCLNIPYENNHQLVQTCRHIIQVYLNDVAV